MVTFFPPWPLYIRSRKGNAYWHTGQDTLKKAATTGPRLSASLKEKCVPSRVCSLKSGADVPAVSAAILFPPKMLRSHFTLASILDDLRRAQNLPRQASQG